MARRSRRRRGASPSLNGTAVAVVAVVAGGAAYGWFRAVDELPNEIVVFLPHLTTLMVLTFASQRLRPPAADGQRYRRGDSG